MLTGIDKLSSNDITSIDKVIEQIARSSANLRYVNNATDAAKVQMGEFVILDDGTLKRIYMRTGQNVVMYLDGYLSTSSTTVAGDVVQMKALQTRTKTTYSIPADNVGIEITELAMTITPKKAGNAMILDWEVFGEGASSIVVFAVYRNSTLMTDSGSNQWDGVSTTKYDANDSSTPSATRVRITDFSTLATSTTYKVYLKTSDGTAISWYLNRAVASSGANDYENGLSSCVATEYYQ